LPQRDAQRTVDDALAAVQRARKGNRIVSDRVQECTQWMDRTLSRVQQLASAGMAGPDESMTL